MTQISYTFPDSPYFDDYDPLKLYYKLLFKPKNLIQARELNQLQTFLQEQIARFGSHIFKNGSIVLGCESKINTACFMLTVSSDTTLSEFQLESLEGQYISSAAKIAQILKVQRSQVGATLELVINDFSDSTITISDLCYLYDFENKIQTTTGICFTVINRDPACLVKFNAGMLYIDGYFISLDEQKIILSSTEQTFSGSIGFQINKVIKEFNGQDILTLNPVLVAKPIISLDSGEDLTGQTVIDDFIEFIRIKNGKIVKDVSVPIYSELEKVLARRTYDQAGNFTVTPFSCKVVESKDPTKFKLEISPGKAYVLGYEFDSPFSQSIEIDKALDYEQKKDYQFSTYYGSYTILEHFSGFFDTQSCEKILLLDELLSELDFGPGGNHETHIIGTARVRHVDFQGDQLILYLFELQAAPNKSISDSIKSIACSNLAKNNVGYGDCIDSKLYDLSDSTLLFELPEKEIRSIRDTSNKVNNDYYIQKTFYCPLTPASDPGSPATPVFGIISTNPGEQLLVSPTDITIVDRTKGTYYHPDTVEALNPEATQLKFGIDLELTEVDVYAKVRVVNQAEIPLTVETKTVSLTIQSFAANQEYTLPDSDVIAISACSFNGTNILNYVSVLAKETLDAVYNSVVVYTGSLSLQGSGTLSVTYSFYKMKRTNGYLSVDSYPASAVVKSFKNSHKTVSLGKCIDFRARIINDVTSNSYIPVPAETFQCCYSYYLPRIDKLIATSAKTFEVIPGTSGLAASPPSDKPYGMTLYSISIPAKTENLKEISLQFVENRRYTMKDIGVLDKRIKNLEYYSALSLLEKDTKDMEILDENGNNRFKNGFVIDNFKNFKSVNFPSGSVKCSFNTELGELRPTFTLKNHKLLYNPQLSTCRQTGDLLTLPYSEVPFIEQLKASSAMNLQPFEVFNYVGKITLSPEVDEWVDTTTKPAIIANQFGDTDIWEEIGSSAFTAQWGSWESKISQIPATQTVSQVDPSKFDSLDIEPVKRLWNPSSDPHAPTRLISTYNDWINSGFTVGFPPTSPDGTLNGQPALYLNFKGELIDSTRTGTQSKFTESKIITSSTGESVSNISIVPYTRAKEISVKAEFLRPNTTFYIYFDETDVTEYCQPNPIISDSSGSVTTTLYLPGGTFSIGSHDVIIRDSALTDTVNLSSYASTTYKSSGLSQTKQETIISTREPVIISNPITESKGNGKTDSKIAWDYEEVGILPTPSVTSSTTHTPTPTATPVPTPSPSVSPLPLEFAVTKIVQDDFNVVFRVYCSTAISFSVSIYSQDNWDYQLYTPSQYGDTISWFTNKTIDETNPYDYIIDPYLVYPNYIKQQDTVVNYITVQHHCYKNLTYPGPIVFTRLDTHQSFSFDVPLAVLPTDFLKFEWIDHETIKCAIADDKQPPYLNVVGGLVGDDTDTTVLKYINDGDIVRTDWNSLTYCSIIYPDGRICSSNSNTIEFEPYKIFRFSNYLTEKIYSDTGFKHKWFTLKVTPGRHTQRRVLETGRNSFSIRFNIRYKNTENWIISDTPTTVKFDSSEPGELRIYNDQFKDLNQNPTYYNSIKWWDGDWGSDRLAGTYHDTTIPYLVLPMITWSTTREQTYYNFYTKEFVDQSTAYVNQGKYQYWIYPRTPFSDQSDPYTGDSTVLAYEQKPEKVSWQTVPRAGWSNCIVNQDIADFFSKPENSSFRLPLQVENYYGVLSNIITFNPSDIGITTGQKICLVDPLAESFFVDEKEHPEGVFASSLDVYFKEKSTTSPVDVQIRPNINGYPSSTEYLPFSDVVLAPDQILVSEDASIPTRFTFKSPVYLKPGDYSLMVRAKDTQVKAWVARLGEYLLGSTDTRITSNAYIGTLFKSANSSTWVAEGETDLKFRLNRCSFTTSSTVQLEASPFIGESNAISNRFYSTLTTQLATVIPANTRIDDTNVRVLDTANSVVTKSININETIEFDDVWYLQDVRDRTPTVLNFSLPDGDYLKSSVIDPDNYYEPSLTLSLVFSSTKETVSPVVDLQKLSITTIENLINYPSDLSGELERGAGPAQFCYITKPVKLSSAMLANKLLINFAGQLPPSNDNKVLVYYRVYNSLEDPDREINQKGWTLLGTKTSNGTLSWVDYTVETDIINYSGDDSITDFDYFQIKLVGVSTNSAKFPKIKDFRTIALTA